MTRACNFSAGPAALPEEVLLQARSELLDWNGTGASVMELSHRSREFMRLAEESEQDLRDLMGIPSNYRVLFLQGGATQHFAQIPMNFADPQRVADYVVTGAWGEKAVKEAAPYVKVRIAATSIESHYAKIPPRISWDLDPRASYVHYTPNETIHGVEFQEVPEVGGVPLIADMSSDILSRPLDVSRFGMIYAGAQKNIGASGLVVVIVRDDLLTRCPADDRPHLQLRRACRGKFPVQYAEYLRLVPGIAGFQVAQESRRSRRNGRAQSRQGKSTVCGHRRLRFLLRIRWTRLRVPG